MIILYYLKYYFKYKNYFHLNFTFVTRFSTLVAGFAQESSFSCYFVSLSWNLLKFSFLFHHFIPELFFWKQLKFFKFCKLKDFLLYFSFDIDISLLLSFLINALKLSKFTLIWCFFNKSTTFWNLMRYTPSVHMQSEEDIRVIKLIVQDQWFSSRSSISRILEVKNKVDKNSIERFY